MGVRVGLLSLALLGSGVAWADPLWSVSVEGGSTLPFPFNRNTVRGTVGVTADRTLWELVDLGLGVRVGMAEIATDVAVTARARLRLQRGVLAFLFGVRAGYAAIHVDRGELGSLWTGALLIAPTSQVSLAFTDWLDVSITALTLSFYWNRLLIVAFEPTLSLDLRF